VIAMPLTEGRDPKVEIADVSSLSDRRRIASLEASKADLERKLAEAMGRARPALDLKHDDCRHFGAPQVHDHTESVTCVDCGAELNPYDVLRKIAHREFNFCYQLNLLREEAERLGVEVKRLKATRSRLGREARALENARDK
jgi:hypothetical protein